MKDIAYQNYRYQLTEIPHHYGPYVHLLADPVLLTQLGRLCRLGTTQPELDSLVTRLYETLTRYVLSNEFPLTEDAIETRMIDSTPRGIWCGDTIDSTTQAVVVDIARAGTVPAQVAFNTLNTLLDPAGVRQDHVYMNRVTNDEGEVTGVSVSGSKIGGDVEEAIVLFPDPMGATGSSLAHAISMYKSLSSLPATKMIALHLLITPEYIRHMQTHHPDVHIYTVRLDRGLSSQHVLNQPPGKLWPEERGLNEIDYIIPGAGGIGEILNNSYV